MYTCSTCGKRYLVHFFCLDLKQDKSMSHFFIANCIAGRRSEAQKKRSLEAFNVARSKISSCAEIVCESNTGKQAGRGMLLVDGDARELLDMRRKCSPELIIEPSIDRFSTIYNGRTVNVMESKKTGSTDLGSGALVELTVRSGEAALPKANSTMFLFSRSSYSAVSMQAQTDAKGFVSFPYNPQLWKPSHIFITPRYGTWDGWLPVTQPKLSLSLPLLPKGPFGWWHRSFGLRSYSERLGEGIRIGIADTGAGPHPYLAHIKGAGAFIGGQQIAITGAESDVSRHGTLTAGVIGARLGTDSNSFVGIAPGAELIVARIFPGGGSTVGAEEGLAASGDIANAIDELSDTHSADIINLSLGGYQLSEIEADAVVAAFERGSLVICAGGNTLGGPVLYPAAHPMTVAVSAVGVINGTPPGSLDNINLPIQPDRYGFGGFYSAGFSSVGFQIAVAGPGIGIISTVPSKDRALYAAASGTSMAAPAVSAALATVLSHDAVYRNMERDSKRTCRAWISLTQMSRSLGLYPQYQGYGYPMAWPQ